MLWVIQNVCNMDGIVQYSLLYNMCNRDVHVTLTAAITDGYPLVKYAGTN